MATDDDIMAQVFAAFCEEQAEHRTAIASLLLELEQHPDHPDAREMIDRLFRAAHSLKGGARAAGLPDIERIAHAMEDLFAALRHRQASITPAFCDPIYAALDVIGQLVDQATARQPFDAALIDTTVHQLRAALSLSSAGAATPDRNAPHSADAPHATPGAPASSASLRSASGDGASPFGSGEATTVRLAIDVLDTLLNDVGELMTGTMRIRDRLRQAQEIAGLSTRWKRLWRQVRPLAIRAQARNNGSPHIDSLLDPHATSTALDGREARALTDALIQAADLIETIEQRMTAFVRDLNADQSMLSAVTDRLHTRVRRTRMLPLHTIFQSLRLVAREVSRSAGKPIDLLLDDGSAEADRQVLELLRDVLTHLLRNAIDHGIEDAETRQRRGKPERGQVRLTAAVEGDWLTIEVADDGAGLDDEAIRRRALELGLLTATDLERLSPTDIHHLIFLPGFSTRASVSHLSGRGVGLDIVHSHIERMQGRIQVQSTPGKGCRFVLNLPVSLTSSHGLLIRLGRQVCAVPLESIQRIISVAPGDVHMLEGRMIVFVDERPVMLVHLADLLGASGGTALFPEGAMRCLALVLGSGAERLIACAVDAVAGEQELVVHRLPFPLKRVRFVAAAAILPDGTVAPILDTVDIVRAASGAQRTVMSVQPEHSVQRRTPQIVVVDDSLTTRMLEKNILEAAGYQVHLATDGAEALDLVQRLAANGGCDLVISDVDMPRLNGFELTEKLRASERFKHLPIILVTSLDAPEHRERGVAVGADAYIVKRAFDQQTLLDTIARLI
ncbi:MAG: hybrid sensor histidine kinase/response regulator [Roseiflexus sp.]|nr:hybrid sensor histidine kinase/response regulator [Roseiflexus sp.]MCS7290888.1 hybrid sensor histidine kinase/response regulator [Roseiflexus sp.]MDW8232732.1 hybrid sensor histidine kinase/response regulator [Roseiflexaceae bacterium]